VAIEERDSTKDQGGWHEAGVLKIWVEESGVANAPAVLLLPGLFTSIDALKPIRDQLAAKGMRVIAADLPGSGKSLPQPRTYTPDYYAVDADALATLLEARNAEPAVLIGFSDGGEVALLLAAKRPDLVKGVLTWGATGKIEDASVAEFFRTLIANPMEGMEDFRAWLIEKYGEAGARTTTESVADAFDVLLEKEGDIVWSVANQIVCPVLLVAGDQDPVLSTTSVHALNARIPNGRVLVVEGGGHALHDTHRALMADIVYTFLFTIHAYPEKTL